MTLFALSRASHFRSMSRPIFCRNTTPSRTWNSLWLTAVVALGIPGRTPGAEAPPAAAPAPAPKPKIDFAKDIAPLIKTYCYECHTGDEPEGEFTLYFEKEADFLKRVATERDH